MRKLSSLQIVGRLDVQHVLALSLWALVSGHGSAWQAARVEVEQQRGYTEQRKHPPEERVVSKLVEETTFERAT
jgi:hypothetical protein